jgi:lambda repressor-like predicted transcriptional regulator
MSDPKTTLPPFADPRQRAIWVMGELKYRGTSLNAISTAHGWSRSAVYRSLYQPSLPQEEAVAKALGVEVRDLFPERYDAAGKRLHRARAAPQCRHVDVAGNDHAREAA